MSECPSTPETSTSNPEGACFAQDLLDFFLNEQAGFFGQHARCDDLAVLSPR